MNEPNPYTPPGVGAIASGTLPFPFDWNRFINAFMVCTFAFALWSGALVSLQTTYALRAFDAESRVGGIVFVGALRELGPYNVVGAAVFALFITMHRQSAPSGSRVTTRQLWPLLLALPITAPVASCLMAVAAFYVVFLAFNVPFHTFWTSIVDFTAPKDVLVGVLKASFSAPVLIVVAPLALRFTFAKPRRLRFKIAATFLASFTINTLASVPWKVVLEAFILGPELGTETTPEPY